MINVFCVRKIEVYEGDKRSDADGT